MEQKKKKIGFTCSYTPLPLIDAAGYEPYRILPMGDCPDQAGHVLNDNLCPHVKKVLDRALDKDLPELDGIVFMNSCDAMRRLYDAWLSVRPDIRAILVDLPVEKDEASIYFFDKELSRLMGVLSEWSGRVISRESIQNGICRYNKVARSLGELKKLVLSLEIPGGNQRLQTVYNHAATESFDRTLERIQEILQESGGTKRKSGTPVYVFGNVMPDAETFSLFESCGADISGENLCTGSRLFQAIEYSSSEDVLHALAAGFLGRESCARTLEHGYLDRMAQDIIDSAKACGARGVIGHTVKFCDPYIFRMPVLSEIIRKEGLPLLVLEGDCTLRSLGQHRTRIEAFVEMLR